MYRVKPKTNIWGRPIKPRSLFFTPCDECEEQYNDCVGLNATMCCSCGYWERNTGRCLIHGEIPDFRGCCGLFEQLKIYDCIRAVVIETKDKRIYCTLLDSGGCTCEECYEMLMKRAEEFDKVV